LRVGRPIYNVRPINCESIRAWWRQILNRDFAHNARRIARPIAHGSFAGENGRSCGGPENNTCHMKTDSDDRDLEADTKELAMYHAFGIASRRRCAWIGVARVSRVGFRGAPKRSFLGFLALAWEKDSAAKFAIGRTRSPAREPRALPRPCSAGVRCSHIAALVFFETAAIETHE
jgi:hypothetical protein